jgi:hypothetical protein
VPTVAVEYVNRNSHEVIVVTAAESAAGAWVPLSEQVVLESDTGLFKAGDGVTALSGLAHLPGGGGGGGGSFPDFTGDGSPEGVQTATTGKSYVDSTNGALYFKALTDGDHANTGWVQLGFAADGGPVLIAGSGVGSNGGANLTDMLAWGNSYNGLYYKTTGTDGEQKVQIWLGPGGAFETVFAADGTTTLPGALTVTGDVTATSGGPVITDQSDGHTYRIISTAGVLSTVQVT